MSKDSSSEKINVVPNEDIEFSVLSGDLNKKSMTTPLNSISKSLEHSLVEVKMEENANPLFGILCVVIAYGMFATTFIIIKTLYQLNPNITVFDHVVTKCVPTICIYAYYARRYSINLLDIERPIAVILFGRVCFGFVGIIMITYAIQYISVSVTTIISNL